MYKRLLIIVIPILLITVLSIKTDDIMAIHFIDVGQGDSIFVDYGDYEILTDAGGDSYGKKVANYIEPYVDGNLELIVATHVHEDHIGGLDDVLDTYKVNQIVNSGENANFMTDEDMIIDLGGGAFFKVIETGDGKSNTNDNSVITMIDYKNIEVLLTGDMEETIEKKNLNKFEDIEVLKAGHHGSKTASCQEFLNIVKPETVIISSGVNNKYKQPHKEAMSRFLGIGAEVYGTYKSNTIVMTTDGKTYTLNTSSLLTK